MPLPGSLRSGPLRLRRNRDGFRSRRVRMIRLGSGCRPCCCCRRRRRRPRCRRRRRLRAEHAVRRDRQSGGCEAQQRRHPQVPVPEEPAPGVVPCHGEVPCHAVRVDHPSNQRRYPACTPPIDLLRQLVRSIGRYYQIKLTCHVTSRGRYTTYHEKTAHTMPMTRLDSEAPCRGLQQPAASEAMIIATASSGIAISDSR